ncbi:MAG: tyrosine-type recombinase/integrase [Candidatus Kariarchaeaceae archaeon]|jgi:integrase
MSRIFTRRKKNEVKNQEAVDVFRTFNRLAPSSREKYLSVVGDFSGFLLVHRKSLWDADFEDLKKFLLESDNKSARSIISTFFRVLIDSGEFRRENPVIQLNRYERDLKKKETLAVQPIGRAATVIQELDESETELAAKPVKRKRRKKISKRIMILSDLERLVKRASHIRDRAILEFLYATGTQILEVVNLNVSDVDLEARQVTIHQHGGDSFRTLILPRRTVNFLTIYERWRRRQLSPSQAYYITKSTKKRMSDSSISTWLNRIQKDLSERERWTAMDFRRRALLQHYWVTRDLTAIARFGGYKRPESALNLISEILADQGVDSIDKLASLPEFEALKGDRKRLASVGEADQLTITIQLDQEEMDIIRNSGLTPTQAVKTIISLKDLYGAFSPGGMPGGGMGAPAAGGPTVSTPTVSSGPTAAPSLGAAPAGPPVSGPAAAPSLDAAPSGPPSLDEAPAAPSLDATPAMSPAPTSSGEPGGPGGPGGPGPGAGAPAGGPMGQLNELKQILAARRARMAKQAQEGIEDVQKDDEPSGLGGIIRDVDTQTDDADDEDEEIDEIPDFG